MTVTGILPTYQRFVNGVPVPFSRRSFRPREKYVVFLVFITFGFVCFGTFFFLPEFRTGGTAESVYKVYDQIKRAGPELLIPPPPLEDIGEAPKLLRHEEDLREDPHLIGDRAKLKAKIEEDRELKVLERPDIGRIKTSSTAKQNPNNIVEVKEELKEYITVPAAQSVSYPLIIGGEDPNPVARERREKIKEKIEDKKGLKEAMEKMLEKEIQVKVEVKAAHKLGERTCLIELESEREKELLMSNKHKLKDLKNERIYINHDMTKMEREKAKEIRKTAKQEMEKGKKGKDWIQ